MEKQPISLYKLELVNGKFTEELVLNGSIKTLNWWARNKGLQFVSKPNELFGGYWIHPQTGVAYCFHSQI